jgi:hypothetical protein
MNKSKVIIFLITILLIIPISTIAVRVNKKTSEINALSTPENDYVYYNYQDMSDLLHELEDQYSDIMSLESMGVTYEERDVWLVKLSDNVNENENEPGVLLMGAHHGNEKPSYEMMIFFIKHMVENYGKPNTDDDGDGEINEDPIDGKDNDNDGQVDEDPSEDRVRNAIDNTQIFAFPMVNPDGVECGEDGTRKNCNPKEGQTKNFGVDLNRNYGYKWELYDLFPALYGDQWTSNPESWNYRGENPFSEVETTAIKNVVEANDVKISLSYHSYGEFITYPWTHNSGRTPDENLFISIGEGISDINDYYLYRGQSHIIPRPGGTLGTSENWLYGEQGVLSFVIELCKERVPTNPSVVYRYCITHVGINLYVCEKAPDVVTNINPDIKIRSFSFTHILFLLQRMITR